MTAHIDRDIAWCHARWKSFTAEPGDDFAVDVCAEIYQRAMPLLVSGACEPRHAIDLLRIIGRAHAIGDLSAFDGSLFRAWHFFTLAIAIRDASEQELIEIIGEFSSSEYRADPLWSLVGHAIATRFDSGLPRRTALRVMIAPFVAAQIRQVYRNSQGPDEVHPA